MRAKYDVTAVQVDTIILLHQLSCVYLFLITPKGFIVTLTASNGSALIFEQKFGPCCRTDRVVDLKLQPATKIL